MFGAKPSSFSDVAGHAWGRFNVAQLLVLDCEVQLPHSLMLHARTSQQGETGPWPRSWLQISPKSIKMIQNVMRCTGIQRKSRQKQHQFAWELNLRSMDIHGQISVICRVDLQLNTLPGYYEFIGTRWASKR